MMTDYEMLSLVIMIFMLVLAVMSYYKHDKWLYNKSWGKEQKSGQSKPNQVKWKCKNPQPEEGILCPRKIIAQNS